MKGSYYIEMEELVRAIQLLKKNEFKIGLLVTDSDKQIAKWLRNNVPRRYDIWHLTKVC